VLECVKEEGVQVVSVATTSASSWHHRRWRWPAFPAEDRGTGELDLERERDVSAEKKRGNGFLDRWQPSPLPMIFSGSGVQQRRDELVSMAASVCSERGSGGEANERQGRAPEGVLGFIWLGWSQCRVHLDDHGWARGAAFLERRCELSAALGVAKSGVHWFGHGMVRFRAGAHEMVRGVAS
jgi:hypothetical protein